MKNKSIQNGYYYIRLKHKIRHNRSGRNNWALPADTVVIAAIKLLPEGDVRAVINNPEDPASSAKISLWNYKGSQRKDFEVLALISPEMTLHQSSELSRKKSNGTGSYQNADLLWAMHIRGADDIHEATTFQEACDQVAQFNQWVVEKYQNTATANDPILWAQVVQAPLLGEE